MLFFIVIILLFCQEISAQKNKEKPAIASQASTKTNIQAAIDSIINVHATNEFSGVLLVADHGKIIYQKAFGYRNFSQKIPLHKNDIFQLASIAKTFTAMMIMILQEKGKLQFDDPVENYLSLPYKGITIRHLLTHTSGLPDLPMIMEQYVNKTMFTDNNDVVECIIKAQLPIQFKPGTNFDYNNTGYILLAVIIEKVTRKNFAAISHKLIFKPLKMVNTYINTIAEKKTNQNFASGHVYNHSTKKYIQADSLATANINIYKNKTGPTNVISTAEDLLKWDQALYTERLLKASTLQKAFTPYKLPNDSLTNYGFGWRLFTHSQIGKKVLHTGITPGYRHRFIRYIDQQKTVILLSNNAYDKVDEIIKQLEFVLSRK